MQAAGTWDRFWYGASSTRRLAGFRMLVAAAALYATFQQRFPIQQGISRELANVRRNWQPIDAFQVLGVDPPGPEAVRILYWVLVVATLCTGVGLFTRASSALAAIAFFLWIATAYSFHQARHDCVALMFALATLPFAAAGRSWSLDAALRGRRVDAELSNDDVLAGAALPLRVAQVTLAVGYLAAGVTKLIDPGLDWTNGYTLQGILHGYDAEWTPQILGSVPVASAASWLTLALFLSFPLALCSSTAARILVPGSIVFHLVTWKTMDTGSFLPLWLVTLAAFVPWERCLSQLRRELVESPWPRRFAVGVPVFMLLFLLQQLYFDLVPTRTLGVALGALLLGTWLTRGARSSRTAGS